MKAQSTIEYLVLFGLLILAFFVGVRMLAGKANNDSDIAPDAIDRAGQIVREAILVH